MVIGNPVERLSSRAFLLKFVEIMKIHTNNISVISGDRIIDDDVSWTRSRYILNQDGKSLTNIMYYFISQLCATIRISAIQKDIDIIIVLPTPFILPVLYSKLKNKKVVIFAAQKSGNHILRVIERLCFMFVDLIIVESDNVVSELNIHKYKNKIVKGSMYVDTNFFKKNKDIKKRKNIVGYIGTLNERKGVNKLIDVIQEMVERYKDVDFLIAGTGPFEEIIRYLSYNNNRVNFVGTISQEDLPKYLNEFKLLILPSVSEGVPNIILEAMACGTPVLTTPVGGIPDIIKDNVTGFIINETSTECMINGIMKVLKHQNLGEIVKNAYKLIEKDFTYESATMRYKEIMKLLDNK